jgi:hypothetical protein
MRRTSSFPTVWRFGLAVFALVAATQYAIDTFHAPQGVRSGVLDNGLFRGGFLRERGPTTFVVDALPPGSPLIAAGVVPGDRLRWSDPVGRWHNVPVGESFDLTVIHGSESRVIRVTTPARSETTRFAVANYVLDNLSRLATLVVAFIVGWRRSDLAAFRWLAIGGLMEANQFPFAAPAAAHLPWLDFLSSVSQELALGAMVFFAINYPDDRPVGLRAWLKRWYPWYFGALVAVTLYYYARLYSGYHEPWVGPLNRINAIVLPILFVVSMLLAWYRARARRGSGCSGSSRRSARSWWPCSSATSTRWPASRSPPRRWRCSSMQRSSPRSSDSRTRSCERASSTSGSPSTARWCSRSSARSCSACSRPPTGSSRPSCTSTTRTRRSCSPRSSRSPCTCRSRS